MLIVCFLGIVKPRKIMQISFLKKVLSFQRKSTIVLLKKYYRFHEKVVSFFKDLPLLISFLLQVSFVKILFDLSNMMNE